MCMCHYQMLGDWGARVIDPGVELGIEVGVVLSLFSLRKRQFLSVILPSTLIWY